MILSTDLAIERVALGMIDRGLPKSEWTHEAHFAAALWLCRNRPDLIAPEEIRTLITRYNEATGTANTDEGGYHHTITPASMRAADHHLSNHPPETPLHIILSSLMASRSGNPNWLLTHWSRELLFSAPSRRHWIEPDLLPLSWPSQKSFGSTC